MKAIINHIIAYILLGCFIPASIGFAFIHHHCSICNKEITKTTLSIVQHKHDYEVCSCDIKNSDCENKDHQSCCCDQNNTEKKHKDTCKVNFKKLDVPATEDSSLSSIPQPSEIYWFFASVETLFLSINSIEHKNTYPKYNYSDYPLKHLDLSIINCVFRL